ncbi:SKN1-domain-containing protein [Ramicandelaber brevisporus]|nr:SKN1-domain-containing protein [Ramicandelaber brevisporus]
MQYLSVRSVSCYKSWHCRRLNVIVIAVILTSVVIGLVIWPIVTRVSAVANSNSDNAARSRPLIDPDTPDSVKHKISADGAEYVLAFSDEFNTPNRSFHPGSDPYWTAVDLYYWGTEDLEYYKPTHVTTVALPSGNKGEGKNGALEIKITKDRVGDQAYTSGMLQSWNQFCFQGGIVELSVSLPGSGTAAGFWPAAWLLGNLGRAGYGATTDGTWPYSYSSCDAGVLPNQSDPLLSSLPGQRLNSCPLQRSSNSALDDADSSEGHGYHPSPGKGRGAPEIDIFEGSFDTDRRSPTIAQSLQAAPFNFNRLANASGFRIPSNIAETNGTMSTTFNRFMGSKLQQTISALTTLNNDPHILASFYNKANRSDHGTDSTAFQTFAMEYSPKTAGNDSHVRWSINSTMTMHIDSSALGPDRDSHVGQRLVPEEPMSIILNLAISRTFGAVETELIDAELPAAMYVDYIRVYQHPDRIKTSCDPPDYPTKEYIERHAKAYADPSRHTWNQTGYAWPEYTMSNIY